MVSRLRVSLSRELPLFFSLPSVYSKKRGSCRDLGPSTRIALLPARRRARITYRKRDLTAWPSSSREYLQETGVKSSLCVAGASRWMCSCAGLSRYGSGKQVRQNVVSGHGGEHASDAYDIETRQFPSKHESERQKARREQMSEPPWVSLPAGAVISGWWLWSVKGQKADGWKLIWHRCLHLERGPALWGKSQQLTAFRGALKVTESGLDQWVPTMDSCTSGAVDMWKNSGAVI